MDSDYEKVEKILRDFLKRNLAEEKLDGAWKIADSPISGRGLRATRDIQPGDVVFWDHPVVIGPRRAGKAVCVGCHLEYIDLKQCPKGCKLPICDTKCADSPSHTKECTILAAYGSCTPADNWSQELLRSVVALRCTLISDLDKQVVKCLQVNKQNKNDWEVVTLKERMKDYLSREDEEWIQSCINKFDTNAFETMKRIKVSDMKREGTLRGLYPLASFMNHDCSPNTTHVFDKDYNMLILATKFIPKNIELTTAYCPVLWDTYSRRPHLAKTKQFACCCERCKDPTEFGTYLSGLPCLKSSCSGLILGNNPLIPHRSDWKCTKCLENIPVEDVMKLQRTQGMLLLGTNSSDAQSILNILDLKKVAHNSVVEVQLKLEVCHQLGNIEDYTWTDLTNKQLDEKERICKELLDLIKKLRLGKCRLQGTIAFELYKTLSEKLRRIKIEKKKKDSIKMIKYLEDQLHIFFKIASDVLMNDATAPWEFQELIKDGLID